MTTKIKNGNHFYLTLLLSYGTIIYKKETNNSSKQIQEKSKC